MFKYFDGKIIASGIAVSLLTGLVIWGINKVPASLPGKGVIDAAVANAK